MCNQDFHLFYFHGYHDNDDDNSDDGGDDYDSGYDDWPIPSPTHLHGNHVNDGVDFSNSDVVDYNHHKKRLIKSLWMINLTSP